MPTGLFNIHRQPYTRNKRAIHRCRHTKTIRYRNSSRHYFDRQIVAYIVSVLQNRSCISLYNIQSPPTYRRQDGQIPVSTAIILLAYQIVQLVNTHQVRVFLHPFIVDTMGCLIPKFPIIPLPIVKDNTSTDKASVDDRYLDPPRTSIGVLPPTGYDQRPLPSYSGKVFDGQTG